MNGVIRLPLALPATALQVTYGSPFAHRPNVKVRPSPTWATLTRLLVKAGDVLQLTEVAHDNLRPARRITFVAVTPSAHAPSHRSLLAPLLSHLEAAARSAALPSQPHARPTLAHRVHLWGFGVLVAAAERSPRLVGRNVQRVDMLLSQAHIGPRQGGKGLRG